MIRSNKKIAVIGGGIFGVTAAFKLSKLFDVDLFEQQGSLLQGATYANHNRHHFGFHYPRSPQTAEQCLTSKSDFDSMYSNSLVWDFENHYCVGKESRVAPDAYIKFCKEMGLEFTEIKPNPEWINPSKIELCLKVKEGVCDFKKLESEVQLQISAHKNINLHLNTIVTDGKVLESGKKRLTYLTNGRAQETDYDFIVSAIYANHNKFCQWFGFKNRLFQFNLQELNLIELPKNVRLGVTIMDGSYPSVLPFGNSPYHILAHVDASQLVREVSPNSTPLLSRLLNITSNWDGVLKISKEFIPILNQAVYHKSIFVDRVVDATASATDARITDLESHGHGCYSIFAAKVITCVTTAKKLAQMITEEAGGRT